MGMYSTIGLPSFGNSKFTYIVGEGAVSPTHDIYLEVRCTYNYLVTVVKNPILNPITTVTLDIIEL